MLDIRIEDSKNSLPIYLQLARQIVFQIEHGTLKEGMQLPATRELAQQLRISRGSVVKAYEELCSLGLCKSHVGQGTIISPAIKTTKKHLSSGEVSHELLTPDEPLFAEPGIISLMPSLADTSHLPTTELRQSFNRVLRYPSRLSSFSESAGDLKLRQLICKKILPSRGINATPEEVLIVPGSQYGSVLMALTLNKSRTTCHFGVPGYLDIAKNFARFGFSLEPHDMDEEGIILTDESLGKTDLLYLMPEHHFPQCITLSDPRRERITSQILNHGLMVIEDDYDSEYYYDRYPQPALKAGLGSDKIIYLGTFSKTLFNSLRLGYVVAEQGLIREMASLHWSLSRGTSGILQQWVAELIESGVLEKHVKRMRSVYRRKRDKVAGMLHKYFPEWTFALPRGGLQFYINVGSDETVKKIMHIGMHKMIKFASPTNYTVNTITPSDFIVLGFGLSPLNQIETAIQEIRMLLTTANLK